MSARPGAGRAAGPGAPGHSHWEFWVDRGGTFTDCIGIDPQGTVHTAKILSSDAAPLDGIRRILARAGVTSDSALAGCVAKLGSTVATNALLERRGVPTVLVANRGLIDVFTIGTQQRPDLFALDIRRAPPLHAWAVGCAGRIDARGRQIEGLAEPGEEELRRGLRAAQAAGARSLAVALIHAYLDPGLERRVAAIARELGFEFVVASHEIAREQGLLARGETAAADAYLTPLLRRHVDGLAGGLPGARLRFMQSSGGLTEASRFRGPNALLSGPAGGVVAAGAVARAAGFERAIGFDMGGTSTDVSLIVDGAVDRAFETEIGGVRVRAPMLRIHTVAAGGGSLCHFDGIRLEVGPESAGADPGPLCYGLRDGAGERKAHAIALTDANARLGRVQPDRFPFALDREAVDAAFERLRGELAEAGFERSPDALAAGFIEVANANMAQAIAQVSVARGVDPRDCALVAFGGAAGQHACLVARALGIRSVLLHPLAGLLSAYGIGCAPVTWDGQRDAGRRVLAGDALPAATRQVLGELESEGREALAREGFEAASVQCERFLDLRYVGTDSAIAIAEPAGDGPASDEPANDGPANDGPANDGPASDEPASDGRASDQYLGATKTAWRAAFEAEHRRRFGYVRAGREIEITTARVRSQAAASPPEPTLRTDSQQPVAGAGSAAAMRPAPLRRARAWFAEIGWQEAPVYAREALGIGMWLVGPALVLDDSGTLVLDPGFEARVEAEGLLVIEDRGVAARPRSRDLSLPDPVRLEVFGNRFMSIAEQMGAVLRNTSVSTNIKERLDYSCAVFDLAGGLVANAPHIPVHLGAMGETVRCVLARFPDLAPGDVVATNDPFEGGSHLPDVTVVTPVFLEAAARAPGGDPGPGPHFFVASRGHHADIGGRTPGSMPPDSCTLEEEGAVLRAFRVVRDGVLAETELRALLAAGPYPARRPSDNVADIEAMVAANAAGCRLLAEFVDEQGFEAVSVTMRQLQQAAASKVAAEIARLPDGEHRFEDRLDDGTPVCVTLQVRGERMTIDFEGTGAAVAGNLNAPRAVVQAAVLYVLRSLVDEAIPLNGGCLDAVELRIPEASLLDPPPGSAVVGGNVETSQRVVDVLLGALHVAAASQGTMNNVTFGDADFGYYETIGGGAGAGPDFDGASGVHTHMTNTRITDPEVLESRYPVVLESFALRPGTGGAGRHRGGDGLLRRYAFTAPVTASWLTERRSVPPYGLDGGAPGACGRNRIERADGRVEALSSRGSAELGAGDRLVIETPGGGGYGAPKRGEPAAE